MNARMEGGGPAFPVPDTVLDDRIWSARNGDAGLPGMSLRDYFAAKAMQALITGSSADGNPVYEEAMTAASAYSMADAMLVARSAT